MGGHPFHPDDFPIDKETPFAPTQAFYLKGAIHFKDVADIHDVSSAVAFDDNAAHLTHSFIDAVSAQVAKIEKRNKKDSNAHKPAYSISSCGSMMRTIKTMTKGSSGERVADLNITFISFDCSSVRFPDKSEHSRHEILLYPVEDNFNTPEKDIQKHEAFVRHSIPYFWDMTSGRVGILYKCLNQKRVVVGKVTAYGFEKDAIMVLNSDEVDDVVALSTCIILLNGRNAMDS